MVTSDINTCYINCKYQFLRYCETSTGMDFESYSGHISKRVYVKAGQLLSMKLVCHLKS